VSIDPWAPSRSVGNFAGNYLGNSLGMPERIVAAHGRLHAIGRRACPQARRRRPAGCAVTVFVDTSARSASHLEEVVMPRSPFGTVRCLPSGAYPARVTRDAAQSSVGAFPTRHQAVAAIADATRATPIGGFRVRRGSDVFGAASLRRSRTTSVELKRLAPRWKRACRAQLPLVVREVLQSSGGDLSLRGLS